jgi:hypothetical protein
MKSLRLPGWLLAASLAGDRAALACPGCRLGREVRASFLGEGLWANLLAVSLPVMVLAVVAWRLSRSGP